MAWPGKAGKSGKAPAADNGVMAVMRKVFDMAKAKATSEVVLRPINRHLVVFRIVGMSPLIQHQWGTKAMKMMLDKKQGKKTKTREVCDPEREAEEATYRTASGANGVPLTAIKSSIIEAAHNDLGVPKTLVKKALFIQSSDPAGILEMECSEPVIGQQGDGTGDPVRVGQGSADLRYRPYFHQWSVVVTCEVDVDMLRVADLMTLVDRAGFGVGIGEWRPEKGGEYGRYRVDGSYPIKDEKVK